MEAGKVIWGWSALLGCLLMPLGAGAERPTLGVTFQVAEGAYRDAFGDEQLTALEADVGAALARLLAGRLRFVEFRADPEAEDRIVVRLGKAPGEPGAEGFRPVSFALTAAGPRVTGPTDPIYWPFRPLEEFVRPAGSAEAFQAEIEDRFALAVEDRHGELIEKLLSRVRLADGALALPGEASWVLPFTREELGIAEASLFRIRAELQIHYTLERPLYEAEAVGEIMPGHPLVPSEFHRMIKARLVGEGAEDLRSAEKVETKEVFLLHYVPLPVSAVETTSPSMLRTMGEGGAP